MKLASSLARLTLAAALFGGLGACAVVPAYPVDYRGAPVYVEPYPTYYYGHPSIYYERAPRHYDHRGEQHYRGEPRRYEAPHRIESPLDNAARRHRDIRRNLGLPRPPGLH